MNMIDIVTVLLLASIYYRVKDLHEKIDKLEQLIKENK
jgi:tetrahydromethanopterin S-methyltransferase subunit B